MTEEGLALDDVDGVVGPQSTDEPLFYEVRVEDGEVSLLGSSPGMAENFDRDTFDRLLDEGEWLPAEIGPDGDVETAERSE